MKNDNTSVDIDFAEAAVPLYARRGIVTMFMIMLGFTFFSASMWVGKELADGLDFSGFIISMIIGGLILSLYTGLLGYVGAETGMSLDLLARKAFGAKGSYLPSAMISFTASVSPCLPFRLQMSCSAAAQRLNGCSLSLRVCA